jgi:hypothetical protein
MRKIMPMVSLMAITWVTAYAPSQDKDKQDKEVKIEQTEAGKKAIAKIRQLGGHVMELAQTDKRLEVSYQQLSNPLTDEHLAQLKDLKGLVHLNLRGQPVTDAQLVHLKDLTSLTRLHLEKSKVTDKGLEQLKGLVNLEYLNIYGTEVTDAGLAQLTALKKLKNLYLWQTKVTDAGVDKLKAALPTTDINRGLDAVKPKEDKKDDKKTEDKKKDEKKDDKKAEEKKKDEKK